MPARARLATWTCEASPFQTAFDQLLATQPAPASAPPLPPAPPASRPANDDFDDWSDVMPDCA